MPRSLLVTFVLLLAGAMPAAGQAAGPCSSDTLSHADQGACWVTLYEHSDSALGLAYRHAMTTLPPPARTALRLAQRAWILHRDAARADVVTHASQYARNEEVLPAVIPLVQHRTATLAALPRRLPVATAPCADPSLNDTTAVPCLRAQLATLDSVHGLTADTSAEAQTWRRFRDRDAAFWQTLAADRDPRLVALPQTIALTRQRVAWLIGPDTPLLEDPLGLRPPPAPTRATPRTLRERIAADLYAVERAEHAFYARTGIFAYHLGPLASLLRQQGVTRWWAPEAEIAFSVDRDNETALTLTAETFTNAPEVCRLRVQARQRFTVACESF